MLRRRHANGLRHEHRFRPRMDARTLPEPIHAVPPLNSSALPGALAALLLLGMACSLALQAADWRSRLEMPSAAPERPH